MGGVWGGGAPSKTGVRRVLDNAVDRAATFDDVQLIAGWVTTVAVSAALFVLGRRWRR